MNEDEAGTPAKLHVNHFLEIQVETQISGICPPD